MILSNPDRAKLESLFSEELNTVLKNIQNTDTDPLARRSITLRFDLKPKGDGQIDVSYTIQGKNQPVSAGFLDAEITENGDRLTLKHV